MEVAKLNGITELARLLKERDNLGGYAPLFGTVIELPSLKIRIGEKVILTQVHLKSLMDLYKTDSYGQYAYLNKEVVLLPYADNQRFIVLGEVV